MHLVTLDARILERQLDARGHAQALGMGVCHVMRVAGHSACGIVSNRGGLVSRVQ